MSRRHGHRHLLLIYKHTLDRWWKSAVTISIFLLLLSTGLAFLPGWLPQYPFPWIADWRLWTSAGAGVFVLFCGIFLFSIRKRAYVQPFADHLRVITPFLRLNISYQRFRRTYTTEMQLIFPPNKGPRWRRAWIRRLAGHSAVVIEMSRFPVSRRTLRLFLSPLFFPDRTARLALLVQDWLAFSTEMESLRSSWQDAPRPTPQTPVTLAGLSKPRP